jgi:beta-fructofuranosidase
MVQAFRDHSAWRAGAMWYQVAGGGLRDRDGALFLYRSADLRSWQYLGVLAAAADCGLEGSIWECPDVFTLGRTVVVVVSVLNGQPPYAMWMTGQIAGHTFTPRATGRCDSGHRYYAPQSMTLADGRRVAVGWLRENRDELAAEDRSRVGVMSLPRELFLDGTGSLRSRTVRELDDARRQMLITPLIEGHGTAGVRLSARAAHATEITLTPARGDAAAVGLRLAGAGCADVQVRVTAGSIEITEGGRLLTAARPVPGSADPRARSGPTTTAGSWRCTARRPNPRRSSAIAAAPTTRSKRRSPAGQERPRARPVSPPGRAVGPEAGPQPARSPHLTRELTCRRQE